MEAAETIAYQKNLPVPLDLQWSIGEQWPPGQGGGQITASCLS